MASCEKCWRDAGGNPDRYSQLILARTNPGCRLHHSRDRLGEALQLLEAAKDALPSDDLVYLRIREFLDQE